MTTFAELLASNPNIRAQYDEWRQLRSQGGEDPLDWGAFRGHLMAIGAPDPGARPPDDFVGEDYKAANPDWARRWYGTAAGAAAAAVSSTPASAAASTPAPTPPPVAQAPAVIDRTRVRAGMEVVGSDGNGVGQVKEVRDNDFLVNRRMARDITVAYSAVRDLEGNKVVLNVPAGQAGGAS
jgi:hypothetical protein